MSTNQSSVSLFDRFFRVAVGATVIVSLLENVGTTPVMLLLTLTAIPLVLSAFLVSRPVRRFSGSPRPSPTAPSATVIPFPVRPAMQCSAAGLDLRAA